MRLRPPCFPVSGDWRGRAPSWSYYPHVLLVSLCLCPHQTHHTTSLGLLFRDPKPTNYAVPFFLFLLFSFSFSFPSLFTSAIRSTAVRVSPDRRRPWRAVGAARASLPVSVCALVSNAANTSLDVVVASLSHSPDIILTPPRSVTLTTIRCGPCRDISRCALLRSGVASIYSIDSVCNTRLP